MTKGIWTDERVATLRKMWLTDGFSCSRIATALGCGFTENAIIGKLGRLGLSGMRGKNAPPAPDLPRPARHIPPAIKIQVTRASRAKRQSTGTVAPYAILVRDGCWEIGDAKPIALMDLRLGMCRWPVGPHPVLFCGAPTKDPDDLECAYCAKHATFAYQPQAKAAQVAA